MLTLIPSLVTIGLILAITALVVRGSNAWFRALDQGLVRLPGFYPEWGRPTGRIAAVLIVLAGIVATYPYIPGAGSRSFQGAGMFVGILAALGSSAVAANVISGVMLIYTRGFQEGDRVEINGVLGVVQDRALLVTRIRTPRQEVVSIPNATVIGASIINYSLGRRETGVPVTIATTVTLGYDVPWRQVHELLLEAAAGSDAISSEPAPYVLQTSLNDFHISYELNAHVLDVNLYRETLLQLLGAIQDQFAAAGVEILSPGYHAIRNGNRSTIPPTSGSESDIKSKDSGKKPRGQRYSRTADQTGTEVPCSALCRTRMQTNESRPEGAAWTSLKVRLAFRSPATTTGRGARTGLGLVDADHASHPLHVLEILDCLGFVAVLRHLDEGETTLAAGLTLEGKAALAYRAVFGQHALKILNFCIEGEVAHINRHEKAERMCPIRRMPWRTSLAVWKSV